MIGMWCLGMAPLIAQAQSNTWPHCLVKMVAPFAVGGVTDIAARIIAAKT